MLHHQVSIPDNLSLEQIEHVTRLNLKSQKMRVYHDLAEIKTHKPDVLSLLADTTRTYLVPLGQATQFPQYRGDEFGEIEIPGDYSLIRKGTQVTLISGRTSTV